MGLLRGWDGEMAEDSAAAALYAAWYVELASMPQDELGALPRGVTRGRFLLEALRGDSAWCDDVSTPRRETCADFREATLSRAVASLRARLGTDPSRWRWGALHRRTYVAPLAARNYYQALGRHFSSGSYAKVGYD